MEEKKLPFTCPVCGRKTDHALDNLTEGAILVCPICHTKITLHGHMWKEIQDELAKLRVVQK
jgi:transcription elongation factor Elf1